MAKKFYEYADTDVHVYPALNEVVYPHCPTWGDDPEVFLIYAENKDEAFKLAMEHLYHGRPLERYYGTYNGDRYNGEVKYVM